MSRSTVPAPDDYWQHYPDAYRAQEARTIAAWLAAGESGVIVGLSGAGRATLLSFLCHRPDVLQSLLAPYKRQVVLAPVDLINLPDNTLATLYRAILRSFYEVSCRFDRSLQLHIRDLYRKTETARDPFLPQSALRELLLSLEAEEIRIGLIFDRFDRFCQTATVRMTNTLRGLRDSFKETLCYLVSLPQEIQYLPQWESLSPLQGILDTHTCWVGPLCAADARYMIAHRTRHLPESLTEPVIARMLAITGGYPSLLRVVCDWWTVGETAVTPPRFHTPADWEAALLRQQNTQHRLGEIWHGLTQEEQLVLSELQKWQTQPAVDQEDKRRHPQAPPQPAIQRHELLPCLGAKGVCYQRENGVWGVNGRLLNAYVAQVAGRSRGKIWLDVTGDVYQGTARIDNLPPLERAVLHFLIQHPQKRHTHTDLIEAAWPDDVLKEGVSTETLYQTIRGIRKKIEPQPSNPYYILNWRGQREGGYHFFPEGRPGGTAA